MGSALHNAHAHLPDSDFLKQHPKSDRADLIDLGYSVINGTSPANWPDVLQFSKESPKVLPAIGLHPQEVQNATEDWKEAFLQLLDNHPICTVGEIGLDHRDRNADMEKQLDAFCWQLKQARDRGIIVSIHCIKAIGLLMNTLRAHDPAPRGIHLHAYNGPSELIPELVKLGACFSFASRQLQFDSEKMRSRIRAIPIRRLLVETDLVHQNNVSVLYGCYTTIAKIRKMSFESFTECIAENFKNCFLTQ